MIKAKIKETESNKDFKKAEEIAKMFSHSTMIPREYRNNIPNVLIALDISNRLNISPIMIMQNLHISYGKPAWSSTFLIHIINNSGKFEVLKYKFFGEKGTDSYGCMAYTKEISSGEIIEGAEITIEIAKKEGWYNQSGSKWQTMPQLMLQYRAASFFSRVYCPEVTLGFQTLEETIDVAHAVVETNSINDIQHTKEIIDKKKNKIKDKQSKIVMP